jgi:hypothetical protein
LEADKWAGSALFRTGATLDQALACVNETSLNGSTTHPPRVEREKAVRIGWSDAKNQGGGDNKQDDNALVEIQKGMDAYKAQNFSLAFSLLSRAFL